MTVATILAYTSPALGNLLPIAALLAELKARGHRIVLRTHRAGLAATADLGFESAPVDPRIEADEMTDWTAPTARAALRTAFEVFGRRATAEIGDLRIAIAEAGADALIVDPNCWGASAVADAQELAWASFWPFPPFLRSPGVPPFGPGLRPRGGRTGRVRDALLRPMVSGPIERTMLGPMNAARSVVGAVPVSSADDYVRRAPLILVATAEPFEYPRPDWGSTAELIGLCEYEPPPTESVDWIARGDEPLVLVTTSSERQDDENLAITAMRALADEPVRVVATFPAGVPEGIEVPANAIATGFLPHSALLARATCAVTHGGMGATLKALARGVPVCVVPYGRDQFEVARRAELAQCGTRLPRSRLSAARLHAKITQAMSMAAGARRVAAGLAAAGGPSRGADLVEQRLLHRG